MRICVCACAFVYPVSSIVLYVNKNFVESIDFPCEPFDYDTYDSRCDLISNVIGYFIFFLLL